MLTQIKQKSKFTQKIFFIGQGLGFEGILSLDFCWLFRSLLQRIPEIWVFLVASKLDNRSPKFKFFRNLASAKRVLGASSRRRRCQSLRKIFWKSFPNKVPHNFIRSKTCFFKWANPLSILIGHLRPLFRLFRLFKQIYGKNVHPVYSDGIPLDQDSRSRARLLFIFVIYNKFDRKIVHFSGIWTLIVEDEGEPADHLTTTTAHRSKYFMFTNLILKFSSKFAESWFLQKCSLPVFDEKIVSTRLCFGQWQCDQIWRFIGLWQQLICPKLPYS